MSISGAFMALVALIAGAVVPLQAASNAALGRALGHPLWATLCSLAVSAVCIVPVMLMMRTPAPMLKQALIQPLWVWLGGVAGVIYITSALMLTPRLGATGFIVCVITGQVVASLLMDHFGWFGLLAKPVNLGRVLGVLLILCGTVLVLWFSKTKE